MRHAHFAIATMLVAGTVLATALPTLAGSDAVAYPGGYGTGYVRYATVDKPERKPPIVRFLYVQPDILAKAKSGKDLPDGTVAVMGDHPAKLGEDGKKSR